MSETTTTHATCRNCGDVLHGRFCSACGQRVVAPYPTVKELVGDAWQELSGYDGRMAQTFRRLLLEPGALTVDVLEGKRARYLAPVRLYLIASLAYFIAAALLPNLVRPASPTLPNSDITIDILDSGAGLRARTPEEQQALREKAERAPVWMKPMIRALVEDPQRLIRSFRQNVPRILFALVPVFAGIVALFYWRRPFPQHLIFALHLHAAIFFTVAVARLANLAHSVPVATGVQMLAQMFIVFYALRAFRRVYGQRWLKVVPKALAISVLYLLAAGMAFFAGLTASALF